jgi:histidyl-tRNA synthetase
LYQAPRGTFDILPHKQGYWRYLEKEVVRLCRLYGYERIDTPVFEDTGLFVRSVGEETDIVAKEMYTFKDRGGNWLTLRPEGTAPVCRAFLEHGLSNQTKPVKLYYLTPIFRYDRPQAGRYRQHHQFGYEAIGDDDPILDAEVIDMAWHFYKSLGLKQLSLLLNSIGCKDCRPNYLVALEDYYSNHADEICPDCRKRLKVNRMRLLDCKKTHCRTLAAKAPRSVDHLCSDCAEHFKKLQKYLKLLKLPFEIEHRLVRGLDYYTRTVFEIQPDTEGAQSTLGGGGRYDDLIEELGGQPMASVGFATGLERVILNMEKQGVTAPVANKPLVFIAHQGEAAVKQVLSLASALRRDDTTLIQATGSKSLTAQLRQANNIKAAYVVIIGEDEVRNGTVVLRNMATSEQRTMPLNMLAGELKTTLG